MTTNHQTSIASLAKKRKDYEKLLEKCNSLLLENFELRQSTRTI